jgi:hypothetical protein
MSSINSSILLATRAPQQSSLYLAHTGLLLFLLTSSTQVPLNLSRVGFESIAVPLFDCTGNNGYPGKNLALLTLQEVYRCRVDGDDDADLCVGVLAVKIIGYSTSMARAFKSGNIQVLIIKLGIKELIPTEGRTDRLVGHLVSRVRRILAVSVLYICIM